MRPGNSEMSIDRIEKMVRAILLNDWDPIGVAGVDEAADEYDSYAAPIARMIVVGASISDLANHLVEIEAGAMGLKGDQDRARVVAAKLRSLAQT